MEKIEPSVLAMASTEGSKDILGALAANQDAASLVICQNLNSLKMELKASAR